MKHCALLLLFILLLSACGPGEKSADIILYNGKIITVDSVSTIGEALALRGGKVLAAGSRDEIMKLAGDSTRLLDLQGHAVIPGLIDAHVHPVAASQSELFDSIPVVNSIPEVLAWIRRQAEVKNDNEWIIHPKFFITRMQDMRQITLAELDAAAPSNPVFLNGSFGGVINSVAMKLSGMSKLDHPGILKDERTGRPLGLIRSSAFKLLAIPARSPLTAEQEDALLKNLLYNYNSIGITSACSGGGTMQELQAFQRLQRKGELTVRIFQNIYVPADVIKNVDLIIEELRKIGVKTGDGDEWVRVGALKVVLDGGVLTGTAFLHQGWGENAKGLYGINDPSYRGELMYSKQQLITIATAAATLGWKFTAHATGGAAVDTLLSAYEAVNSSIALADRRFSVIHGNFFTPESIRKMSELGVYADMQPAWFFEDTDLLNHVLGSERIKTFHPYRSLMEAGVVVNGGSDHMVKADADLSINPYNPFTAIWAIVTRTTEKGTVFQPDQAITREQALKMYTINNAYASFEEKKKGSLERDKYADLVVLSEDILTCPEQAIRNIKPLLTMVGGKVVFDSKQLSFQ